MLTVGSLVWAWHKVASEHQLNRPSSFSQCLDATVLERKLTNTFHSLCTPRLCHLAPPFPDVLHRMGQSLFPDWVMVAGGFL